MEKAIEIKRRAQRCILNGDLDGALHEYEKLIASGDSDPYHSVLLADLLYKKGDHEEAGGRYLEAVAGYEAVGLTKNAIAVCKKMSRLSLRPAAVLQKLAGLHAHDGLSTEASLYYLQHADLLVSEGKLPEAEKALREAFRVCPENVRALERIAEVQEQSGSRAAAAATLIEAAGHHERMGGLTEAKRCRARAEALAPAAAEPAPAAAEPAPEAPPEDHLAGGDESEEAAASLAADLEPGLEPGLAVSAGADHGLPHLPDSALESPARPVAAAEPVEAARETAAGALAARGEEAHAIDAEPVAAEPVSATAAAGAGPASAVAGGGTTPEQPGLDGREPPAGAHTSLPEVSLLLNEAQELFRLGRREAAGAALVRAAQTYDRLGRFDSAASIYRSLSQVNEAPLQVMLLWLKNCQRRDDRSEAARVACELGDRALAEGDAAGAREWFERARGFDPSNELAERRLQRLLAAAAPAAAPPPAPQAAVPAAAAAAPPAAAAAAAPPVAAAPAAAAAPPAPETRAAPSAAPRPERAGLVEIAIHTEEPVGIDLGTMIAEFQRGLEHQLDSDPQGHYDLGMSYREMGLYEHAIDSFRTAAASPAFRVRASEMIGRCLLDQGDFDQAAEELARTLTYDDLAPAAAHDLRFQLGLAFEVGGRPDEALRQFERLYADEPNYPDVAFKIRALRKALEMD